MINEGDLNHNEPGESHEPEEELGKIKEPIIPEERDWKPVEVPKKLEPKQAPIPEPKLRYSGNSQEFRHDIKDELRRGLGTRLSAAERAGTTKLLARRGGKYLGTKKGREDIRKFGKEQGWSPVKIRRVIREAKNLKGKMGGAS